MHANLLRIQEIQRYELHILATSDGIWYKMLFSPLRAEDNHTHTRRRRQLAVEVNINVSSAATFLSSISLAAISGVRAI
jgi:hypothetical protein